jgi:histidyl-tRNA synthetase
VIALAQRLFESLGLERFALRVNSMGDQVCRPAYVDALRSYLDEHRGELCDEHRERYAENPLRVLDCKKPGCVAATEGAPMLIDALCEPCRLHHERVLAGLKAEGIVASPDDRLVRGFDYYTRTTFEFASEALEGAQNAIGGGGRYDGLVELLGGPPTPGIGFGIGIERVLLACDAEGCFEAAPRQPAAFVVDVTGGEAARDLVAGLRRLGLYVERSYGNRSMKAQFKAADRSGAAVALLIGPEERAQESVTIRALRDERPQRTLGLVELLDGVERTGEISW